MDPYKVLGVSPSATDDEVKTAYRNLAKKYHPDKYVNNPLADLAGEKMKEINQAYDEITKMRKNGSSGSSYGSYGSSGSSYGSYGSSGSSYSSSQSGYSNSQFQNIRDMLSQGRIAQANSALDSIPQVNRNAEWHFLKGITQYKAGWTNEALLELQNAVQLDPSNAEYRQAYTTVKSSMNRGSYGGNPYGGYGNQGPMQGSGCNACDLCAGLACADCLCGGGGC